VPSFDIHYQDLIEDEMSKDNWENEKSYQKKQMISERWDFLKAIEMFNRKIGHIDKLTIACDTWQYGFKFLGEGEQFEHWVTIESLREFPHDYDIDTIKIIGLNCNWKIAEKETIVESLLEVARRIEYYNKRKFEIIHCNGVFTGVSDDFDFLERT
jgi:hypothetical protein